MNKKPCRFCQRVRGTVKRALGRKTMAELTEEARDASAQRQPLPQRARHGATNSLMSLGTPNGPIMVGGSHMDVDWAADVLLKDDQHGRGAGSTIVRYGIRHGLCR